MTVLDPERDNLTHGTAPEARRRTAEVELQVDQMQALASEINNAENTLYAIAHPPVSAGEMADDDDDYDFDQEMADAELADELDRISDEEDGVDAIDDELEDDDEEFDEGDLEDESEIEEYERAAAQSDALLQGTAKVLMSRYWNAREAVKAEPDDAKKPELQAVVDRCYNGFEYLNSTWLEPVGLGVSVAEAADEEALGVDSQLIDGVLDCVARVLDATSRIRELSEAADPQAAYSERLIMIAAQDTLVEYARLRSEAQQHKRALEAYYGEPVYEDNPAWVSSQGFAKQQEATRLLGVFYTLNKLAGDALSHDAQLNEEQHSWLKPAPQAN